MMNSSSRIPQFVFEMATYWKYSSPFWSSKIIFTGKLRVPTPTAVTFTSWFLSSVTSWKPSPSYSVSTKKWVVFVYMVLPINLSRAISTSPR